MKNQPILRWALISLLFGVIWLLGIVIVPSIYAFRTSIREGKKKGKWFHTFLWYFLNDTTKTNEADIDWGDYGRFSHNFYGYIKQCLFRNSHWNLKILLVPKRNPHNKKDNVVGTLYQYNVGKPLKTGVSKGTYSVQGQKHFRFCFTLKYLWYCHVNGQFGSLDHRYVFKFKNGFRWSEFKIDFLSLLHNSKRLK
jgi:hypothetical protein